MEVSGVCTHTGREPVPSVGRQKLVSGRLAQNENNSQFLRIYPCGSSPIFVAGKILPNCLSINKLPSLRRNLADSLLRYKILQPLSPLNMAFPKSQCPRLGEQFHSQARAALILVEKWRGVSGVEEMQHSPTRLGICYSPKPCRVARELSKSIHPPVFFHAK